jgi:hypothetical protein
MNRLGRLFISLLVFLFLFSLSNYTHAATILVSDSFDRPDNSSTLGSADTGQTWQYYDQTWGIYNNQAQQTGGVIDGGFAYVDAGQSDVEASATIEKTTNYEGIIARANPADGSYLFIQVSGGGYGYQVVEYYGNAGGYSIIASSDQITPQGGDVLKAVLRGPDVTIEVNGTQIIDTTSSLNENSTYFGINGQSDPDDLLDNFLVTTVDPFDTEYSSLSSTINPGALSFILPSSITFSSSGVGTIPQTTLGNLTISDLTGSGNGWHVSVSASQFASGSHKLPLGSLTLYAPSSITVNGDSTSTLPKKKSGSPWIIDNGSSPTVLSAAVDAGMGSYTVKFPAKALTLSIPSSTYAGTYTSTLTWQLISGP